MWTPALPHFGLCLTMLAHPHTDVLLILLRMWHITFSPPFSLPLCALTPHIGLTLGGCMPSSPCQCFDSLPQIPFTNEHPPNTARCVTPMPCLSSAWIPSSPCTGSVSQCQTSPQGGEWSSYTINLIVLLSSIKSFRASYYLHDNIQTPLSGTKAHLYSGTGLLFMITIANVHLY